MVECVEDFERKERKLIKQGIQKTLTSEKPDDKIDWEIADKFSKVLNIDKVIECNNKEIELTLDTFSITTHDFDNISKIGKEIYGEDCKFHFNAESKFNISFGIIRRF